MCLLARPAECGQIATILDHSATGSVIARGLGRAYGDAAINGGGLVLDAVACRRFLSFDGFSGIVDCEAGVSLAEIIDVFLPRGWFPGVTPGTRFVTVGGAIAADVHGKNHHVDGSFASWVEDFDLLTADGQIVTCTREATPELYWATLGGMGLTGVILRARIRLRRVASAYVRVTYQRTKNLEETLAAFAARDADYRYSVAWIDCLARGKSLGRSVLMLGEHAAVDELPRGQRDAPYVVRRGLAKRVPFHLPSGCLNRLTVQAFNDLYYAAHADGEKIIDYGSYFYPLDGIRDWNRIYGRRGFVQYQVLFPHETSHEALRVLLEEIAAAGRASFLAVLKRSGEANPSPLSYLHPGHTLALDFPYTGEDLVEFLARLDQITLRYGGRLYLAKDAMTTPYAFAEMYPRLAEFRDFKARIDPAGRFSSTQARRLQLVNPS